MANSKVFALPFSDGKILRNSLRSQGSRVQELDESIALGISQERVRAVTYSELGSRLVLTPVFVLLFL